MHKQGVKENDIPLFYTDVFSRHFFRKDAFCPSGTRVLAGGNQTVSIACWQFAEIVAAGDENQAAIVHIHIAKRYPNRYECLCGPGLNIVVILMVGEAGSAGRHEKKFSPDCTGTSPHKFFDDADDRRVLEHGKKFGMRSVRHGNWRKTAIQRGRHGHCDSDQRIAACFRNQAVFNMESSNAEQFKCCCCILGEAWRIDV